MCAYYANYISHNKIDCMKSQDQIEATFKSVLNNSVSKQQYSFSRQPRFIDRLALAKTILDKFYDVNAERCKLGGFFSKSKRVTTEVKEDSPSPDHYNPKIIDIKKSVSFHAGRQVISQLLSNANQSRCFTRLRRSTQDQAIMIHKRRDLAAAFIWGKN